MKAIETVDLTKRYKTLTAVDGLNLTVEKGELFSLLGVNGAGKTTAIKMLSCLSRPTGGDARLMGYSVVSQPDKVKALIGVSPQETAVALGLTVGKTWSCSAASMAFPKKGSGAKRKSWPNSSTWSLF